MAQVMQDVVDKANAYKKQKKGWKWIAEKLGVDEVGLRKAVAGDATHGQAKPLTPDAPQVQEAGVSAAEAVADLGGDEEEQAAAAVEAMEGEIEADAYTKGKRAQSDHAKASAEGKAEDDLESLKASGDVVEHKPPRKQKPKLVQGEGKRVLTQRQAILRAFARAGKPLNALQVATSTGVATRAVELEFGACAKDDLLEPAAVAGYYKLTPAGKHEEDRAPADGVMPERKPRTVRTTTEQEVAKMRQSAEAEGAQAAEDVAGVSNAEMKQRMGKPAREKKEPKAKAEKANWEGYGMCELLRWCGKHGMHKNLGAAVIVALGVGFEPRPNTIAIQNSWGRNGTEPAPDLTEKQAAHLRKLSKELDKTVPAPRGKAEKTKASAKKVAAKK